MANGKQTAKSDKESNSLTPPEFVNFLVRMPKGMLDDCRRMANIEGQSVTAWIRSRIAAVLKEEKSS